MSALARVAKALRDYRAAGGQSEGAVLYLGQKVADELRATLLPADLSGKDFARARLFGLPWDHLPSFAEDECVVINTGGVRFLAGIGD